jgi:hypothetical protein
LNRNRNKNQLSSLELSTIPSDGIGDILSLSSSSSSSPTVVLSPTSSNIINAIEEGGLKNDGVEDGEMFEEKEVIYLNLSNDGKNKKLKIEQNISMILPPAVGSEEVVNKVELLLQTFTPEEIYLITKYTGGNKLDYVFCSNYLLNICTQLNCLEEPKFEYQTVSTNQIICYAALGSPITPDMRCQMGPVGSNLIEAKGLLSLICIKMILNCKDLSLVITPINRNSNIIVPVNTVLQNTIHRFDTESIEINVKTIPDILFPSNAQILSTMPTNNIETNIVVEANSITNNEKLMFNFPLLRTNLLKLNQDKMKEIDNIFPSTPSSSDSDSDSGSDSVSDSDSTSGTDYGFENEDEYKKKSKKIREDQLNIDNENELNGSILLYFYAVRAICENGIDSCIHTCGGCIEQFKGLNSIGIAIPNEIPKDITDFSTTFSLRELDGLELKFQFLGSHYVNNVDLNNMQRFHRGSYCWESDGVLAEHIHKINKNPRFEDEIVDYMDGCFEDSQSNKTIHDSPMNWAASSNGCYYIVFPLPDTVNVLPITFEDAIITDNQLCGCINSNLNCSNCNNSNQKCNIGQYNHFSTQKWSDYIKQCADESQVLIHNLLVLEKTNKSLKQEYNTPFSNRIYKKEDLKDKVYIKGTGELYMPMQDNKDGPRNLDSVMKMVKAKSSISSNSKMKINLERNELDEDKLDGITVEEMSLSTDKSSVFIRPDGNIEKFVSNGRYPVTFSEYYKFRNPEWTATINKMRSVSYSIYLSIYLSI